MTAQWSADQSTWPAHLRDDAPSQQCGRCGRYTWSPPEFGAECRMPQPDGYPCGGRFEPPGVVLDIYAARYGTPVPTDLATPLPDTYLPAGKGKVRLSQKEPHWTGDVFSRAMPADPQLLITWTEDRAGWYELGIMYTIVGQGRTADGRPVRMVAYRASHIEHELRDGTLTTTANLRCDEAAGAAAIWYFNPAEPAA